MTTGTLIHIAPGDVVIGTNVRLDARLDKAFIDSVRERGVLVPIVGHRDNTGRFVVLYGQRRTLAAAQTRRPTIPALEVDTPEEADRLVDQMAENDHRAAFTTAERAKGYEQLAALGLTAEQIAKRTHRAKDEVDAGLRVAKSELASKAAARWDFLTLDQAAGLAEFEHDREAVERLAKAAKEGGFDHVLQRLRDDRDEALAIADAEAALEADGVTVVDAPHHNDAKVIRLNQLDDAEGEQITVESHADCPGHAAYVRMSGEWVYVDEHGNEVDDDEDEDEYDEDADEDEYDEDGDEPADKPVRKQVYRRVVKVTYVCTDAPGHGHVDRWASSNRSSSASTGEMTDEDREAAKAARRDVIQSNKEWDSAEKVRRAWLKTFLTAKKAPKGTGKLIAAAITAHMGAMSHHNVHAMVDDLLGVKAESRYHRTNLAADASEDRALVIALAQCLAGFEAATSRMSWRAVSEGTSLYLKFLAANGYELSHVEKRAAGLVD